MNCYAYVTDNDKRPTAVREAEAVPRTAVGYSFGRTMIRPLFESENILMKRHMSRRSFLRTGGFGLAATTLAACAPGLLTPTARRESTAGLSSTPAGQGATGAPLLTSGDVDVELALTARPGETQILSGQPTQVWQLEGQVLSGDPSSLTAIPDSYLGPTIHLQRGQRVRIHFTNQIPQESIIHWHGLHVPAEMDGHPRYAIPSGQTYVYEFTVLNRAGTYWYHPHPHGRTGPQVYAGMAGLFLVSDPEENALGLPQGEFDMPLVLQDRTFDAKNQLVYLSNGPMDGMLGFLGEQVLVNGQINAARTVAPGPHRLRLLNGSNSRIYKLGWSNGMPMTAIATDGGLLERPVERPYITLAPAERVEIWVDFGQLSPGSSLVLENQSFVDPTGMMGGMGMMGQGAAGLPQGEHYPVFTFQIAQGNPIRASLPDRLSTVERIAPSQATATRTVALAMQPPSGWTLNGRTFQMTDVAQDEQVLLGSTEIWEFVNQGGTGMGMMGGMGMLPHPIHMHGQSFQVLEREMSQEGAAIWESLRDGFVDEGWKDTVLVLPGQTVRVIRQFKDFEGLFLYHCHNLEHEDMGMMRNFQIVAPAG